MTDYSRANELVNLGLDMPMSDEEEQLLRDIIDGLEPECTIDYLRRAVLTYRKVDRE